MESGQVGAPGEKKSLGSRVKVQAGHVGGLTAQRWLFKGGWRSGPSPGPLQRGGRKDEESQQGRRGAVREGSSEGAPPRGRLQKVFQGVEKW